ncbi:unnamed protein product, partial [Ceratitis capitata]
MAGVSPSSSSSLSSRPSSHQQNNQVIAVVWRNAALLAGLSKQRPIPSQLPRSSSAASASLHRLL